MYPHRQASETAVQPLANLRPEKFMAVMTMMLGGSRGAPSFVVIGDWRQRPAGRDSPSFDFIPMSGEHYS